MNPQFHNTAMTWGVAAFLPPFQGSRGWGIVPRVPPSAPPWAIFLPPLRGSRYLRSRWIST